MRNQLAESVDHVGFAVVEDCLTAEQLKLLRVAVEEAVTAPAALKRGNASYAIRNVLDVVPSLIGFQQWPEIRDLVEPVLGPHAFLVRVVFFDKTPEANWALFWHQDLSIAVKARHDVDGFGPWTRKDGVNCVQPPLEILENMLTVRLHLDDCADENGALQVLPRSHLKSRLDDQQTQEMRALQNPTTCSVFAGGAVLMRPLLLHCSSKSTTDSHRRVLHCEFAATDLPGPLEWHRRLKL